MRRKLYCLLMLLSAILALPGSSILSQDKKDEEKKVEPKEGVVIPAGDPVVPGKTDKDAPKDPDKPQTDPSPASGSKSSQEAVTVGLMPVGRIRNKIDSMTNGQQAWISLDYFRVDSWRRCWIHPAAITGMKSVDRVICVKKDTKGFHVILEKDDMKFEAVDVDKPEIGWIAVASVLVK